MNWEKRTAYVWHSYECTQSRHCIQSFQYKVWFSWTHPLPFSSILLHPLPFILYSMDINSLRCFKFLSQLCGCSVPNKALPGHDIININNKLFIPFLVYFSHYMFGLVTNDTSVQFKLVSTRRAIASVLLQMGDLELSSGRLSIVSCIQCIQWSGRLGWGSVLR